MKLCHTLLRFELFRVNEAEFILRMVSSEGHKLHVEGKFVLV